MKASALGWEILEWVFLSIAAAMAALRMSKKLHSDYFVEEIEIGTAV